MSARQRDYFSQFNSSFNSFIINFVEPMQDITFIGWSADSIQSKSYDWDINDNGCRENASSSLIISSLIATLYSIKRLFTYK